MSYNKTIYYVLFVSLQRSQLCIFSHHAKLSHLFRRGCIDGDPLVLQPCFLYPLMSYSCRIQVWGHRKDKLSCGRFCGEL